MSIGPKIALLLLMMGGVFLLSRRARRRNFERFRRDHTRRRARWVVSPPDETDQDRGTELKKPDSDSREH